MNYSKEELTLINKLYDDGLNRETIAVLCNDRFHNKRPIRTTRGIEFVLLEKLNRKNDRFQHVCEVCKTTFNSGWPNSRYCSDECIVVVKREYANRVYRQNPKENVLKQTIRARKRYEERWKIILSTKGDFCSKCKQKYPIVVYDLHHPNGKSDRKHTPSKIIRTGTDEAFRTMLLETEILCANCHRLHHATTGNWAPMRNGK